MDDTTTTKTKTRFSSILLDGNADYGRGTADALRNKTFVKRKNKELAVLRLLSNTYFRVNNTADCIVCCVGHAFRC